MTMTNPVIIETPDEMKSKCVCCDKKSQRTHTIECRFRPGYDDKNKLWTDLPSQITIFLCAKHHDCYLENRKTQGKEYGVGHLLPCGKDWWDILDGVEELPEYEHQ